MADFITFVLSNFTLTFFLVGLLWSAAEVMLWHRGAPFSEIARIFLSGYLLFSVGFSFLYNAIMHTVFAEMCARFIGWANSPFQYELGYASLGFAVVGFLAHRSTFHFRLAAILGPALFLWGAAGGHIYQYLAFHNTAPGNVGMILWTDIFLPVIGFVLLALAYPRPRAAL